MAALNMTRTINATLATVAITLISGCAQTFFAHDTKTTAEFERDKYDCEMVATQYTANAGFPGNPLIIRDEMRRCLKLKHGWREVQK